MIKIKGLSEEEFDKVLNDFYSYFKNGYIF